MSKIYFEKINVPVCDSSRYPSPAVKQPYAEWWENMPRHIETDDLFKTSRKTSTVKNCPAIVDTMNSGYILYIPYDFYINSNDEENIYWTAPSIECSNVKKEYEDIGIIGFNSPQTMNSFYVPDGYHKIPIKWNPLWSIRTDPGYSCLFTHPFNRYDLPFLSISGIVDTDVFPAKSAFSIFIKKNYDGIIKANTPMLQIIPFKRENFESSISNFDSSISDILTQKLESRLSNSYKKIFWNRKKYL